jgi:hypothetical protein
MCNAGEQKGISLVKQQAARFGRLNGRCTLEAALVVRLGRTAGVGRQYAFVEIDRARSSPLFGERRVSSGKRACQRRYANVSCGRILLKKSL